VFVFTRWDLARNPFDPTPISLATLEWFVGRTKEVHLCQRLVAERSVIVVEGDLGVGTTSFGNVVRFRGPTRTPRMELAVYRGWQSQTLLENVLVAVVHELLDDPKARKLAAVRKVRALVQRVEKAAHSAGISLLGFGGQLSRNVAVTQPGIVPLETLRQGLVTLAEELPAKPGGAALTIQLNNLDPELTFTEDELETFLNDIRDSLQLPGFSWLLVGKKGLAHFVTRRVPRLRSIIAHHVLLEPLSAAGVRKVIDRRIASCALPGRKGKNPIDLDLLQDIYEACGGSLRETFIICGKLCLAMATDPLYERITRREASALLRELLAVRLASIGRSPLRRRILKELREKPGLTQRELVQHLGKSQTGVSRAAKALVEADLIRRTKKGRQVRYWPAPEVRLAPTDP
jgi:DNA-binding transcriptional ArsR family regulator